MTLLAKRVGDDKNRKWIYRFWANPGMPRGGVLPPTPVLAPGSALGSRPRVALSSAQAPPIYSGARPPGNSRRGHSRRYSSSVTRGAGPGAQIPRRNFPALFQRLDFPRKISARPDGTPSPSPTLR